MKTWELSELVVEHPTGRRGFQQPQKSFLPSARDNLWGLVPAEVGGPPKDYSQGRSLLGILPDLQALLPQIRLSEFSFLEITFFYWCTMAHPQSSTYSLDILKGKGLI